MEYKNTLDLLANAIEKAKRALPIGTEKTWSGKVFVKTATGWVPKGKQKGPGAAEDPSSQKQSKQEQPSQSKEKKPDISAFAAKASDKQLEAAIKDPEAPSNVKAAAQKELGQRTGGEEKTETSQKEDKITTGIKQALQRLLDAADEFDEDFISKVKSKLDSLNKPKEESSKPIDEATLDKKLDNLRNEITSSLDKKLDELKGKEEQKKIKKTGLMIEGKKVHITLEGDTYVAKGIGETFKSKPGQGLSSFKEEVKEHYKPIAQKWNEKSSQKEGKSVVEKQETSEKKEEKKPAQLIKTESPLKEKKSYNAIPLKGTYAEAEIQINNVIDSIDLINGDKAYFKLNDTDYEVYKDGGFLTVKDIDAGEELISPYSAGEDILDTMRKLKGLTLDNPSSFITRMEARGYQMKMNKETSLLDKSLSDKLNDAFNDIEENKDLETQVDKNILTGNMNSILFEYSNNSENDRVQISKNLVDRGYLPVVNGILFSEYNGNKYIHFNDISEEYSDESVNYYEKGDVLELAPKNEKDAIWSYQGSGYEKIRDFNYGKLENNIEVYKALSQNIENFIEKNRISDYLVLNRRMRFKEKGDNLLEYIKAKPGDVIKDASFSSFSLNQINYFGGDMQVTLLAKPNDKIANIGNETEQEYLVQRNAEFKVIARGTNSLVIELINHED